VIVPANQPTFGLPEGASEGATYLLAVVDPDAPTPQQPNRSQILHMLAPGVQFSSGQATFPADPVVSYNRPRPPPVSSAHRYVELLYNQPSNFSIPAAWSGYNATNRTLFDIDRFAADSGLGSLVAVNYFLVSNQSSTNTTGPSGTGGGTGASPTSSFVPISTGGAMKHAVGGGLAVGGVLMAAILAL
jgi:hypothetical protein